MNVWVLIVTGMVIGAGMVFLEFKVDGLFGDDETARSTLGEPPVLVDGDEGEAASFTYVDADGVITQRQVINWHADGGHLLGHCLLRHASRTFRIDGISGWIET